MRVFHYLLRDLRTVEQASAVPSFGINSLSRAINASILPIELAMIPNNQKKKNKSSNKENNKIKQMSKSDQYSNPIDNLKVTKLNPTSSNISDFEIYLQVKRRLEFLSAQRPCTEQTINEYMQQYDVFRQLSIGIPILERVKIFERTYKILTSLPIDSNNNDRFTKYRLTKLTWLLYDISRSQSPTSERCIQLYDKIYDIFNEFKSNEDFYMRRMKNYLKNIAPWFLISKVKDISSLAPMMNLFWDSYNAIHKSKNYEEEIIFLQKCNLLNLIYLSAGLKHSKIFEDLYNLLPIVHTSHEISHMISPALFRFALKLDKFEVAKISYKDTGCEISPTTLIDLMKMASSNGDSLFLVDLITTYHKLTKRIDPQILHLVIHSQLYNTNINLAIQSLDSFIDEGNEMNLQSLSSLSTAYTFDPCSLQTTSSIVDNILNESKHIRTKRVLLYTLLKFMIYEQPKNRNNFHKNSNEFTARKNAFAIAKELLQSKNSLIFKPISQSIDEDKELTAFISLMCHCSSLISLSKLNSFEFFNKVRSSLYDRKLTQIDYLHFINSQLSLNKDKDYSAIYIYLVSCLQDHSMIDDKIIDLATKTIEIHQDEILINFIKHYQMVTMNNTKLVTSTQLDQLKDILRYRYSISTLFMVANKPAKTTIESPSRFKSSKTHHDSYGDISLAVYPIQHVPTIY